jgi:hypothetical protein
MKTPCEDQVTTNNMLDIKHPALDDAYRKLKEEHPTANITYLEKLFEEIYKCQVEFDSVVGGTVTFNTNKDLVWFLLKNDSTGNNE